MKKHFLYALALSSMVFLSCENDEKNARIEVWLTDAPGDFQEVNIDLQSVEVHSNQSDNGTGWKAVDVEPKVYDLLKLANGNETLLGSLELPGGRLSQIRLKLGDNNSVMVDDAVYALTTPSSQQSGLKLQINETLAEGITYKILLDFEAGKSVIKNGAGVYILKPVIRAITEAQSGAIKGGLNPDGALPVTLIAADTVVSTTTSDENGNFLFRGLKPGTYGLKVDHDGTGEAPEVEKTNITVELGVVTDVGEIEIAQ